MVAAVGTGTVVLAVGRDGAWAKTDGWGSCSATPDPDSTSVGVHLPPRWSTTTGVGVARRWLRQPRSGSDLWEP